MIEVNSRRPSEWRRLFAIAADSIDQLRENAGGFGLEWSFGGGTIPEIISKKVYYRGSEARPRDMISQQPRDRIEPALSAPSGHFRIVSLEHGSGFQS